MEYYPALEGNGVLTHTVAWMGLEDIIQHEISKTQKGKHCMISLIFGI